MNSGQIAYQKGMPRSPTKRQRHQIEIATGFWFPWRLDCCEVLGTNRLQTHTCRQDALKDTSSKLPAQPSKLKLEYLLVVETEPVLGAFRGFWLEMDVGLSAIRKERLRSEKMSVL